MDEIFNTVDATQEQIAQDDAVQADPIPQADDGATPLSEFLAGETSTTEAKPEATPAKAKEGPGWYRQALASAKAEWQKEKESYEQQLAEYREMKIQSEAKKLAQEENISETIALRLLRAEQGMPAPKTASEPPADKRTTPARDDKGRFVKAAEEPVAEDPVQQRAAFLIDQNDKVKREFGVDALELYNTNEKARAKVNSGEWDFKDLVLAYMSETGYVNDNPPAVRSTGGMSRTSAPRRSIADMPDEEFEKLNANLARGARYDMTR